MNDSQISEILAETAVLIPKLQQLRVFLIQQTAVPITLARIDSSKLSTLPEDLAQMVDMIGNLKPNLLGKTRPEVEELSTLGSSQR